MRDRGGNTIQAGDRIAFPSAVLGALCDGVVVKVAPSISSPGERVPQVPTEVCEVAVTLRIAVPVGQPLTEFVVAKAQSAGLEVVK